MVTTILPFIATAISFAGKIITAIQTNPETKEKSNSDSQNLQVNISPTLTMNKQFLENVIDETSDLLSKLMSETEARIIEEIKNQIIKDAVYQLQAHTKSLRHLLDIKDTESAIATQLVITALNPLQVSLEVAKMKLEEQGQKELWNYCYFIGGSALLAGYAYIGQDMSSLKEEITSELKRIQRKMLNETAFIILQKEQDFPWERVPALLSVEGAEEMAKLYLTLQPEKAEECSQKSDQADTFQCEWCGDSVPKSKINVYRSNKLCPACYGKAW